MNSSKSLYLSLVCLTLLVLSLVACGELKTEVVESPPIEPPTPVEQPAPPSSEPPPVPLETHVPSQPIAPLTESPPQESVTPQTEVPGVPTQTITILNEGFTPNEITIPAGTTVRWENARSPTRKDSQAMIIGLRECKMLKSALVKPNESFEHTFVAPVECTYVDGIRTTQSGKIVVT